ncbi:MAG: lysophospholipid acyltransferase family protein [Bacillota bacterium]|nr:lysophospholipid acyltransferase family protein [Bacillota bacterium]
MIYTVIRMVFKIFFKLFYRSKYYGLENLPSQGPYIICSNHTSWFDPPVVTTIGPWRHRVSFMAKEELFKIFIIGFVIRRAGAFPVKRNTADRKAIKHALDVLSNGGILGLFPEGTRIRAGELGEPQQGAAMIALKSNSPVLPVAIIWSGIFRPVKVRVGSLLYFKDEGKIKSKNLEQVSRKIMDEIRNLL